jgi:hypothetical protein
MRKQDFVKLAGYVAGKMTIMFEINSLLSGRVFMKNDPFECDIHICDDKQNWDYVFFEHDDYHNAKFDIDRIFEEIKKLYKDK